MVGFTTRSVQIKLRGAKDFNKTFTWGKNVFSTKEEAQALFDSKQSEWEAKNAN